MSPSREVPPVPVVLVHGLRVSGAALHRIAAGITDRPVRTPDLPGHGTRSNETFTIDAAVTAVVNTVHDVGAPAVVAGMSLGGYVSMAVAGRHPEAVAGLAAMCATTQPSRLFAAPFRAFGAATGFLPRQAAVISKGLTRVAVGTRVAEDMEAGGLALHSIRDVVDELSRFDALAEVARYPGPIEFINGGWDQFRLHEQRFASVSPHAQLQVIPRAAHLFPLIQPNRTASLIGDFARRCDQNRPV
ncbi:alpha/beta fold hydrolase [Gordonia sp. SID5947]|uniref:alpha/beta fold hydrolase n=1 Tax=Gordonia sp. SID5947 TaxID=2690315 RepID=UPI00137087EB|nr:alpha/beta hydrolase [Gordonia sp. SID5947]MYR06412.1 alpha/beta fold hydrolase [Gordonia sp. SID5947]